MSFGKIAAATMIPCAIVVSCVGDSASGSGGAAAQGAEGGPCYPNGTCNHALSCSSGTCVSGGDAPSAPGDSSSGSPPADVASDSPADANESPSCADYCASMHMNCTAANAQYKTDADCLKACGVLSLGTLADVTHDTVGCREHFAGAPAQANPQAECPNAGPFGGKGGALVCADGDSCAAFCLIALSPCTGPNQAFATPAACQSACTGWPIVSAGLGLQTGLYTDTFNCRSYLLVQALSDPASNCSHFASPSTLCYNGG
jgi:hypothetical protein